MTATPFALIAYEAIDPQGIETSFTFVIARIDSTTPSFTPRPEAFTPPNGASSLRKPGT